MELLDSVFVRSVLAPFLATALFAGTIRWIAGGGIGKALAGGAVAVVFMWALATRLGVPDFPPSLDSDNTLYVMLIGLLVGIALDVIADIADRPTAGYQIAAMILFGLLLAVWLEPGISVISIVAATLWVVIILRLRRRSLEPAVTVAMLAMGAAGMIVLAWIGGLALERDLAVALAAALGGFLLWSWPPLSYPAGVTLLLAGTGGIFALALRLADSWPASIVAFAMLSFVFFADSAARRLSTRPVLTGRAVFPLTVAALALLPIALGAVILLILTNLPE